MTHIDSEGEKIFQRIPREIIILSLVLALLALLFFDVLTGLFVFAGGALSAAGFVWLKQSLSKLLLFNKTKALKSAIVLYGLRLLLILAIFFIIILFFSEKIIAFAAGFSAIILVFLAEAAFGLSRLKKWKN